MILGVLVYIILFILVPLLVCFTIRKIIILLLYRKPYSMDTVKQYIAKRIDELEKAIRKEEREYELAEKDPGT